MSALLMAIFFNGLGDAGVGDLDRPDDRLGRAPRPLGPVAPERRQALHRRGGRQGLVDPRSPGRRVRRGGAPTLGARPRAHRRHARQARVDARLARGALQRRDPPPARGGGGRRVRGRSRPRAGRPAPLRAARRDRHRRVDSLDRVVDHVEEDRRGDRRPGARRQGRSRRLHEGPRPRPGPRLDHGGSGRLSRRADPGPAERDGRPAGARGRQRPRGDRGRRGAARRRTGRRARADPRPGAPDGRAHRVARRPPARARRRLGLRGLPR